MTFANVLLLCLGGIAACAALVFVVETLVAFCLHEEQEEITVPAARPHLIEHKVPSRSSDKAA